MAPPLTKSNAGPNEAPRRRSTRLEIAIPISISGKDTSGHAFKEDCRTSIVNKHGAKIGTFHNVALGMEILIENRALGLTKKSYVVWVGKKGPPQEPLEIGLQLAEPGDMWGIAFPPDDWQEGAPVGLGGQKLDEAAIASLKDRARASPPESAPRQARAPSVPPAPLKPAAPAPPSAPPSVSAPLDSTAARFAQAAEQRAEAQIASFQERLAKLTQQIGHDTQARLQDVANRIEGEVTRALEPKVRMLAEELRSSRAEAESVLAKLQLLSETAGQEAEKVQQNVREASWQALQGATEELSERVKKELDVISADFTTEVRARLDKESAAAVQNVSEQTSARLRDILNQLSDKTAGEISERLRKNADELRTSLSAELRKQAEEAKTALREELRSTWKGLVEDARKELGELAGSELEKIRQARALLEGFHEALQNNIHEYEKKSLEEILPQLQDSAGKFLDDASSQMDKLREDSLVLVTEKLAEEREKLLLQAEEDLRARMEEVFSSVMKSVTRKAQPPAAAQPRKGR